MKCIYAVHPCSYNESLPPRTSIAYTILNNFYLFQGWHRSEYIVKLYMNFIDRWFDNSFSKLKLRIVKYEFPDYINYSSGEMIDWIVDHYGIEEIHPDLELEHEICIMKSHSPVLDQMEVILNHLVMDSYYEDSDVGIFNQTEEGFEGIRKIISYIKDNELVEMFDKILDILQSVADSAIAFNYKENQYWGASPEEMGFDPTYFMLYELIYFVYDQTLLN